MKGITYINTKTTLPGWVNTVHKEQPRGYAYETDTHFIHLYGRDKGFYVISVGLTATEQKNGTLEDWAIKTFGAKDIELLNTNVGNSVEGVWRPSLYYYEDTFQALNCSQVEMRLAEQSLRLIIEKLDELFLYIEPDKTCLETYSHKTRELLILSCTEVENSWKSYIDRASAKPISGKTYTTKDYVKLLDRLHLKDYQFKLKSYGDLPPIRPFEKWDPARPSASLEWYTAYNNTKHDRTRYFSKATLWNCINAVVANLILHCVKFSPIPMFEQNNTFSSLINQHFDAELVNCSPTTFYVHKFDLPSNTRNDLIVFDPRKSGYAKPFNILPLTL